jgi:hypothetical protein
MYGVGVFTRTCRTGDRNLREFSRISVVIPVRVEIIPAPTVVDFAAVPGTLLNIGRGGGRVRLRWEFQPQTRLFVSLPVCMPSLRLSADVIWVCHPFDRGGEPAVYGVRWVEPLSSAILESVLMRQGLAVTGVTGEGSRAPRPWK